MQIVVRRPTEAEVKEFNGKPEWGCGISEFDWFYDEREQCILTEGEVTVDYNGESVTFGAGDHVTFPAGLSCVWKVTKPVKKNYQFG